MTTRYGATRADDAGLRQRMRAIAQERRRFGYRCLSSYTVTAGQILQGLDGSLTPAREWQMVVTDEFQNPLFVLHISTEKPR